MKLNLKSKNKETVFEADVEKLIEKGMDISNKDWKDKLLTKSKVKKEIQELKHKEKIEFEEVKQKRKGFFDKRNEEKMKLIQMKIDGEERKSKQKRKNVILAGIFIIILIGLCILMACLGIE